jgi:hypothetical protein
MPSFLAAVGLLALAAQDGRGEVAARVNGEVITWDEVNKKLRGVEPVNEELRFSKLREVAEDLLFLQEARKLKIKIEERQIDERLDDEIRRVGGEDNFMRYLATKRTTRTEYREELRNEMLVATVIAHKHRDWISPDDRTRDAKSVVQPINEIVGPEEVRAYYLEHPQQFEAEERALVARLELDFKDEAERREKLRLAHSLRRKLMAGTDFQLTVRFYSDGPKSDTEFIKWETRDSLRDEEAARLIFDGNKEPGKVTSVLERPGRFLIYLIPQIDKREAMSLGDATGLIRTSLIHEKRKQNKRKLLEALIKAAHIEPQYLFQKEAPAGGGAR